MALEQGLDWQKLSTPRFTSLLWEIGSPIKNSPSPILLLPLPKKTVNAKPNINPFGLVQDQGGRNIKKKQLQMLYSAFQVFTESLVTFFRTNNNNEKKTTFY